MTITYVSRKVNLRDNFKERVEKKLKKFERIFSDDATVTVTVSLYKNRQTVEVTIKDDAMVYRAESTMEEMNDALDKVVDIIGRQIRKNKTKLEKKMRSGSLADYIAQTPEFDDVDEEEDFEVIRTKEIPMKPLMVDEAILQMNMVNHKFFMFKNAATNEINVVYTRDDGKYGLLEPVEM